MSFAEQRTPKDSSLQGGQHEKFNLIGQRFAKFAVIDGPIKKIGDRKYYWLCKCVCGKEKLVSTNWLITGYSKSCGCSRGEYVGNAHRKHGMCRTRTYQIWVGAKDRCYNKNNPNFNNYGGRGITVCERWRESFENFYADMGEAVGKMTLNRIDTNGNYEPSNCRWATMQEQNNNRRDNIIVLYNGEQTTLPNLARQLGINYGRLRKLYRYKKLDLDEAITICQNQ